MLRKSFGGAFIAMGSKGLGADRVFAWPGAQVDVMGATAAVEVLHRRELAAERDPSSRAALVTRLAAHHEATTGGLTRALECGAVDEVVEPAETRRVLLDALADLPQRRGTGARERAAVTLAGDGRAARGRVGDVAYTVLGQGGPVTVFAHGLGGSSAETRPLASRVPGTRVLLSFRGHGDSGPLPGGWDYDVLADDLRAVADETGATCAVGLSLGAGALLRLLVATPGPLRPAGLRAAGRRSTWPGPTAPTRAARRASATPSTRATPTR